MTSNSDEQISVGEIAQNADTFLRGLGAPMQRKPQGMDAEYDFPTNAATLTSLQLGNVRLQLSAWQTYILFIIGKEETELSTLESVYEMRLGSAMNTVRVRNQKGVIAKEILASVALTEDKELERAYRVVLGRRARLKRLQTQADIYKEQLAVLSREQSRREAEQQR